MSIGGESRKGILFRRRSYASLNSEKSIEISFTKDCFVRVLYNHAACKEFEGYIEVYYCPTNAHQSDHCRENLMFFNSYSKLEKILIENVPLFKNVKVCVPVSKTHPHAKIYGGFIAQFLQLDDSNNEQTGELGSPLQANEIYIPSNLYSHYLLFHASYLAPGAPHEVNISDRLRKKIAESLSGKSGKRTPANIFEKAVKEVMDLMYLNSYKKFVKTRAVPLTPPLSFKGSAI